MRFPFFHFVVLAGIAACTNTAQSPTRDLEVTASVPNLGRSQTHSQEEFEEKRQKSAAAFEADIKKIVDMYPSLKAGGSTWECKPSRCEIRLVRDPKGEVSEEILRQRLAEVLKTRFESKGAMMYKGRTFTAPPHTLGVHIEFWKDKLAMDSWTPEIELAKEQGIRGTKTSVQDFEKFLAEHPAMEKRAALFAYIVEESKQQNRMSEEYRIEPNCNPSAICDASYVLPKTTTKESVYDVFTELNDFVLGNARRLNVDIRLGKLTGVVSDKDITIRANYANSGS